MRTIGDTRFALVSMCGIALWMSQPPCVDEYTDSVEPRLPEPSSSNKQRFKLKNGEFTIEVKWGKDQFEQREQLEARISFMPSKHRCPACKSVKIIQVAKVLDNQGKDIQWNCGESNRNKMRTRRGWFVDHRAAVCVKARRASLFYESYWPGGSSTGSNLPGQLPTPAVIEDAPNGWDEISAIYLETCAVDEETGAVLASIKWGGTWSIAPNSQPKVIAFVASDRPSADFAAARKKFADFYCRRAGDPLCRKEALACLSRKAIHAKRQTRDL